jgi:hypothetical protein
MSGEAVNSLRDNFFEKPMRYRARRILQVPPIAAEKTLASKRWQGKQPRHGIGSNVQFAESSMSVNLVNFTPDDQSHSGLLNGRSATPMEASNMATRLFKHLLFGLSAFALSASAAPLIDQSSFGPDENFASDVFGTVQAAQTFRVGITGMLVQLDLLGRPYLGAPQPESFFLDIRGVVNSHPDDSVVLQTVHVVPGFTSQGVKAFALQVPVTQGDLLSFVVYNGNAELLGYAGSENSTVSAYEFGELWDRGNPPFGMEGPGSWYPNGASTRPHDLLFRTYVEPREMPEPASLGLMVIGIAAMGMRRKGRAE